MEVRSYFWWIVELYVGKTRLCKCVGGTKIDCLPTTKSIKNHMSPATSTLKIEVSHSGKFPSFPWTSRRPRGWKSRPFIGKRFCKAFSSYVKVPPILCVYHDSFSGNGIAKLFTFPKQSKQPQFPFQKCLLWKAVFLVTNCADKKGLEIVNGELLRVRRLLTALQPRTFHEIRVKLFAKSLAIWGPFFAKLSTPEHDNTIAFKMKTGSFLMKQDFSCSSCRWSSRSTSWSRRFRLTWLLTAWIGIPKITFPSPRTSPWDSWIILVP